MQYIRSRGFTLIELLVVIAIIGILSAVVLASLNTARSRANDAKVQSQLSSMRAAMEVYYATAGSYGASSATDGCNTAPSVAPWSDSASGMINLADEDNYVSTAALACYTLNTSWAATALLSNSTYFCVDSTGAGKNVGASATISGTDTVC